MPNTLKKLVFMAGMICHSAFAQSTLKQQATSTMLKATAFMDQKVSTHGGYVWYYLPDLSRRWGEMEAYPSMVWVQDGGTVNVGHMLLDAYHATNNEYFYSIALKAASALMAGQSKNGGWNYLIDFAGEASLKKWYATIGKNGWRLEEFQHYYGNDTFDDDVSSNAARFLLRMYLEKKDASIKRALDKAIAFILKSQYANGGWPQRYPLVKNYSAYYTFNDDVTWENVHFLMQCYKAFGEDRFVEPIRKGMYFYLLTQAPNGAWGEQYDMNLNIAGARSYEPAAYLPRYTYNNCFLLLDFYQYTKDKRFLAAIPRAIDWLMKVKLPADQTEQGKYTHSYFVDTITQKPIYVHRRGSNVQYGYYYTDTNHNGLLSHMYGKNSLSLSALKEAYEKVAALPVDQLNASWMFHLEDDESDLSVTEEQIKRVIEALDDQGRWLVEHVMISHPYHGDGVLQEPTDRYASVNVGDQTDTSPYRDTSDQKYISTPVYIAYMQQLIRYIRSDKKIVWELTDTTTVGDVKPEIVGSPKPMKGGVFFDGVDDGMIVSNVPIDGANAFSIEVLFKPDGSGPKESRFIHVEDERKNRGTLEVRITPDGHWYFDGFLKNGETNKGITLIDSTKQHVADQWYWAALVYDGHKMYSYINGHKELESDMDFPGLSHSKMAIGMRLNKVSWFKGQVGKIIFHSKALQEGEFSRPN